MWSSLGRYVNPSCPVNYSCKLNDKLVSRWQVIPNAGWRGGLTFRDLCNRHHASLATITGNCNWRGPSRPGGYGTLYHGGPGSVGVSTTAGSGWMPAGDLTIVAWFNCANTAVDHNILFSCRTSDGDGMEIGFFPGFNRELYGGNYTNRALSGNTSVLDGIWYRVALVSINGGTTQFYLNGIASGTTGTTNFATRTPTVSLACATFDPGYILGGVWDDMRVINRAWTSSDANWDYQEARQGYRESLNWIGSEPRGITESAAATSLGPPIPLPRTAWSPLLRM